MANSENAAFGVDLARDFQEVLYFFFKLYASTYMESFMLAAVESCYAFYHLLQEGK